MPFQTHQPLSKDAAQYPTVSKPIQEEHLQTQQHQ